MPDLSHAKLNGIDKVALVTGATGGIGLWTARGLAERGYALILPCRDPMRGEKALGWLRRAVPEIHAECVQADLSRQADVAALAATILGRYQRLDLLVNNAGLIARQRQLTEDNVELMLAVNYLAPFLLTAKLLPLLRQTAATHNESRIVHVGSASADKTQLDLSILRGEKDAGALSVYAQTKLALLIHALELARRLRDTQITVNCVHPGVVRTGIGFVGGPIGLLWGILTPFLISPRQGAATTLAVGTDPAWAKLSGCYVKHGRSVPPNSIALNPAIADELWQHSTRLTLSA
jgi:retinol dehydrogenase 12